MSETGDDGDADLPDNRLFEWYRTYIGEPDGRTDVYLGFGLFFSGIALAAVALLLFLFSGTMAYASDAFWTWRRPAYALGMLSLPASLVGVTVLLPVERRAVFAAAGGAAVTVVAVLGFALVYPENWNVAEATDYSMQVVGLYATGLAVVVASTGAALVAHQLEQARKPRPSDIEPVEEEEPDEHYSEEEIQADIDAAMDGVDISWGGVEKTDHKTLNFSYDEGDIDKSGMEFEATKTRSTGVDSQVSGLKQLKGGEKKTGRGTGVDDQTSKLNELKQQKRKEEAEETATTTSKPGLFDRIKALFT